MQPKLSITQARSQLLSLARYLDSNPDEVVLLEHRDLDETLALTTARHLHHLERLVAEMRKRQPGRFRMAGSATVLVSDDELDAGLAQARLDQTRLAEARQRRLMSED